MCPWPCRTPSSSRPYILLLALSSWLNQMNRKEKGKKADLASNVISSTLGTSAMRGLRLEALSLIRSVSCLRVDPSDVLIICHGRYSQIMLTNAPGLSKRSFHLSLSYLTQSRKLASFGTLWNRIFIDFRSYAFHRLRNGQSIRTVSALLLQLVQTSAHNVRTEARRIARARQQQTALRRQDSSTNVVEPFLDEQDSEVNTPTGNYAPRY